MFMLNFFSFYIKTNLTLYNYVLVHRNILMYVILAYHFIYVDVHLKTILAVTFTIII